MLHRCPECATVYLTSDYRRLCNICGEYLKQRIERVYERDGAEEWWVEISHIAHGEQVKPERRWEVK